MDSKPEIIITQFKNKISSIEQQIENAGFTSAESRNLTIQLNTWKSALELVKCDS